LSKSLIIIDIPGLEPKHVTQDKTPNIFKLADTGHLAKLNPVFPAVTCSVQTSILSGTYPETHGIISNGLYDRRNYTVSFWEQSSSLVETDRVWDIVKRGRSNIETAAIFWQNTMYAEANVVLTPRPLHMENQMIMWCYSKPPSFYEQMLNEIGNFDLSTYWGPLASSKSSRWIGRATEYTLEKKRPNILFTYLPHLDYVIQREGTSSKNLDEEINVADEIVGNIVKKSQSLGIQEDSEFIVLSEYAFTDVSQDVPLNRIFREHGLLQVREINGFEFLDLEYSEAFAMVDHQVAHIYLKENKESQVRKVLDGVQGISTVLDTNGKEMLKINHPRSGDLIAISEKQKWFSYYWWFQEEKSPPFASRVDIHRKPGYDPSELFIDPKTRKIPLNGNMVRASHGRVPLHDSEEEGFGIYVSNQKSMPKVNGNIVDAVSVGKYIAKHVS
jgi:predicted AlkP superfamily pyrophosphatase or phosphodiesterase